MENALVSFPVYNVPISPKIVAISVERVAKFLSLLALHLRSWKLDIFLCTDVSKRYGIMDWYLPKHVLHALSIVSLSLYGNVEGNPISLV